MTTPDDLRYTSSHEWARQEADGTVTIARLALRAPHQKGRDLEVSVIGRLTTKVEP